MSNMSNDTDIEPMGPESEAFPGKHIEYTALHREVLAVAVNTIAVGDWAAYIIPVRGICHDQEWHAWAEDGVKLPKNVAEVLFPRFAHLQWRD